MAVGTAMVGIGVASLTMGDNFNSAMGGIQAQTGQTAEDISITEQAIRDLALEQGRFTALELAEGLETVSRRGQDAAYQTQLLKTALRLAESTGSDFGSSLGLLDALMVKFNTDLEDSAKWVNTLAVGQQELGIANYSMVEGLQRSAGIAGVARLEYDFLAASLSIAYQGGMSMATAATGLTGVMNQMLDPTSNIREAMQALGVEVIRNEDGTTNAQESLLQFMDVLYNADGLTQEYANTIMGLVGSNLDLFNNLLQNQDALEELTETFGYSQKAGDEYSRVLEMIETRSGGFGEALGLARNFGTELLFTLNDIIGSRFYAWLSELIPKAREFVERLRAGGDLHPYIERLGGAISEILEAIIGLTLKLVPIIIEWLPKFAEALIWVIEQAKEFPIIFGAIAIAILKPKVAIFAFKKALSLLKIGFKGVKLAIGLFKGKAGLAGLIPAFAKVKGKKGFAGLATSIRSIAGKTAAGVGKAGGGALGVLKKGLMALGPKGWIVGGIIAGGALIVANWDTIRDGARAAAESLSESWSSAVDNTETAFGRVTHFVGDVLSNVSESISETSQRWASSLRDWADNSDSIFLSWGARGLATVVDFGGRIQAGVASFLGNTVSDISSRWEEASASTESRWGAIRAFTSTAVSDMRRSVSETMGNIVDNLSSRMMESDNIVTRGLGTVVNTGNRLWRQFRDNTDTHGQGIIGTVRGFATSIVDRFRNTEREMPVIGTNVINGLRDGMSRMWGSVRDTVAGWGASIAGTFRSVMGIQSPSRVMRSLGIDTARGLEIGLERGLVESVRTVQSFAETIVDTMTSRLGAVSSRTQAHLDSLSNIYGKSYREIYDIIVNTMIDAYQSGSERMSELMQTYYKKFTQSLQKSLDFSKKWIYEQREMNNITAQEVIEAWERVVDRHIEGSEQRIYAEERLAEAREYLAAKQVYTIERMKALEDSYLEAVENRTQAIINSFDMFAELNLRMSDVEQATKAVAEAERAYMAAKEALRQATEELRNAESGTREYERAQEALANALRTVDEAQIELTRATEANTLDQATIHADRLQDQKDAYNEFWELLDSLTERGFHDIAEQYKRAGVQQLNSLRDTYNSSEDSLNRLQNMFYNKHRMARERATHEMRGLREDTNREIESLLVDLMSQMQSDTHPIGTQMVQGIINGVEGMNSSLRATMQNMAQEAVNAAKSILQMNSPEFFCQG
ncbi:MAG: phage tail tape measure protein [Defluviitaleaceae bacterium]|nr:phage tail tape measure protein [Defluviitaleaceae bacterium]